MYKKLITLILPAVLLGGLFFDLNTNFVQAAETGSVSIFPATFDSNNPTSRAWFQLSLKAGEKYSSEVAIFNKSSQDKTFEIYAVDGTTTKDGAFALYPKGTKEGIGRWVSLSQQTATIKAGEKINIPFEMAVPGSSSPGDYTGGIVVEEPSTVSQQGVNIVSRIGTRIYLNVLGQVVENVVPGSIEIKNIVRANTIELKIINNGNTKEKVKADFTVVGILGVNSVQSSREIISLPNKEVVITQEINSLLPLYASSTISYGKDNQVSKSISTLIPATVTALVAAALILIFTLFKISRRK